MTRHIVASLDCEHRWLPGGPSRIGQALPRPLRRRLSLLGTLLRVFAAKGDTVWTLEPLDPSCLVEVPGAPNVALRSGIPEHRDLPTLDWGGGASGILRQSQSDATSMQEAVWRSGPMTRERRIAANRRTTLSALKINESIALRRAQEIDPSLHVWETPWVVKGDLSVAGRDQIRGENAEALNRVRARIEKLVSRHGGAVVEPWRDRIGDVGIVGVALDGSSAPTCWIHRQESSTTGGLEGIVTADDPSTLVGKDIMRAMQHAFVDVTRRLSVTGPLGIDAYVYVSTTGERRLAPVSEVNARMTMGMVAHAWREQTAERIWGRGPHMIRLGFSPLRESRRASPDVISLLHDVDSGESLAWLERLHPGAIKPLRL